MGRQAPMQTNFTAGEFSPRLLGRQDIEKYKNAVKQLTNFKTFPHGGANKRAGTKFAARVKDSTKLARLIDFVFSTEQAYALEFGDLSIRAHTNGAQLVEGGHLVDPTFTLGLGQWTRTLSGAGAATWQSAGNVLLDTGTAGGHFGGIRYETALAKVSQRLSYSLNFPGTVETVTIKVGTTPGASDLVNQTRNANGSYTNDFTPTTSRTYIEIRIAFAAAQRTVEVDGVDVQMVSQTVWEMVSPYLATQLAALKKAQSADTMYLVHPSLPPQKIRRFGATQWDISEVVFLDGPYLDENIGPITITPSGTAVDASITLTASDDLFKSGHVGAYWRIRHGATTGYVKITVFTNSKTVTATVKTVLGATTATATWSEGAWSGVRGYPSAIAFYEERLFFANTAFQPAFLWGSVTGDYENMTPGVNADDAVVYEIREDEVNAILWLRSAKFLFAGTTNGEHRIGQQDASITPTNIKANQQHSHGSANVQPVKVGSVLVFLQRAKRKLREMIGTEVPYDSDSEDAADLTIFSEHITRPGLSDLAYQQEPDSIVWGVREDGDLVGMTYERRQKVVGFHRHETDGVIESQCVIPVADGDQHWELVRRTIGGVDYRSVEFFQREHQEGDDVADDWYVDCGVKYDGRNTGATTMQLEDGEAVWTDQQTMVLRASTAYFTAGDVGNAVVLNAGADNVKANITEFDVRNLLTRSEEFDHADWTKAQSTVTPNVALSPDGNLTADLIVEDTATNEHAVEQNIAKSASALVYVWSFYVKKRDKRYVSVYASDATINVQRKIDLDTGAISTVYDPTGAGGAFGIEALPNGVFRGWSVFTSGAHLTLTAKAALMSTAGDTSNYVGDGVSGNYFWGAQLQQASSLGPYVKTVATATPAGTVVAITPNKTVPASLRNVAVTDWEKALPAITGLSHLEGKTVAILADGAVHPQKVVTGGAITLDDTASRVIAGLPYTATLVTLPPAAQIAIGSGHARLKRWAQVFVRLYNTMGLRVGVGSQAREVPFRSTEDAMDAPEPLFSGLVEVPQLGYSKDAPITFTHDWPTPCTILAITGSLDVSDD